MESHNNGEAFSAATEAIAEERARIAMDLHDGVIQSLYAIALGLGAQARSLSPASPPASETLTEAAAQINRVIGEIRDYVATLRPEEVGARGLITGMQELTGLLHANGLSCPRIVLDPRVERGMNSEFVANLLFVAREGISNIIRHADATEVCIDLAEHNGALTLSIQDNGRGFDPQGTGRRSGDGLHNIAERARVLGATCEVTSLPGRGTTLTLRAPAPSTGATAFESDGLRVERKVVT